MKTITALLIVVVSAMSLYARLGESVSQCKSRYGKPESKNKKFRIYKHNGKQINCYFAKGKCNKITYYNVPIDDLNTYLNANSKKKKWNSKDSNHGNFLEFIRSDKKAKAKYTKSWKRLTIEEYKEDNKNTKKNSLKGL